MAGTWDVRVAPAQVATAGQAADEVATGVRAADVAGPVRALAGALPGSATAAVAEDLAVRWASVVVGVGDGFGVQAAALSASAESYGQTEQQISGSMRTVMPGPTAGGSSPTPGAPGPGATPAPPVPGAR